MSQNSSNPLLRTRLELQLLEVRLELLFFIDYMTSDMFLHKPQFGNFDVM